MARVYFDQNNGISPVKTDSFIEFSGFFEPYNDPQKIVIDGTEYPAKFENYANTEYRYLAVVNGYEIEAINLQSLAVGITRAIKNDERPVQKKGFGVYIRPIKTA